MVVSNWPWSSPHHSLHRTDRRTHESVTNVVRRPRSAPADFRATRGRIIVCVLGALRVTVGIAMLDGVISDHVSAKWEISRGSAETIDTAIGMIDGLLARVDKVPTWAIVVGVPGSVDFATGASGGSPHDARLHRAMPLRQNRMPRSSGWGWALVRDAQQAIAQGAAGSLADAVAEAEPLTPELISRAAGDGDALAISLVLTPPTSTRRNDCACSRDEPARPLAGGASARSRSPVTRPSRWTRRARTRWIWATRRRSGRRPSGSRARRRRRLDRLRSRGRTRGRGSYDRGGPGARHGSGRHDGRAGVLSRSLWPIRRRRRYLTGREDREAALFQ